MEKAWTKIVEERLKRNCDSAVTRYSLLSHKKISLKREKPNGLVEKQSASNRHDKPASQSTVLKQDDARTNVCFQTKSQLSCIPITGNRSFGVPDVEHKTVALQIVKQEGTESKVEEREKLRWPGVQEIMEAYERYARGILNFIVV